MRGSRFIFVQPMFSKQELNADSNYVLLTALLRQMRRLQPEWMFFVTFPDAKSGFTYDDDGFFALPNVVRVPQRVPTRKQASAVSYDAAWWESLTKALAFELVWCNLVEIAGNVKAAIPVFDPSTQAVPIVAQHHYVIHKSLPYPIDSMENVLIAQLSGALQADVNVFHSSHCRSMLMDNAREYLSQAALARLEATARDIPMGTLEPELSFSPTGNSVPVIAYNHRLQGYKNWRDTFAVLEELYGEGVRFKVRCTGEGATTIKSYPFVEVKFARDRKTYLSNLAGCDLNVLNSVHETLCIAAIESMALGQPLVAPQGVTFPEITGQAVNGYPYLFKSRDEQKAMLRRLLLDREERLRWGRVLSDHVTQVYSVQRWAEAYAELFGELFSDEIHTREEAMVASRRCLEEHNGCSFWDFKRALHKIELGGKLFSGPQSFPPVKVLKLVRALGGKIVWQSGTQVVYA